MKKGFIKVVSFPKVWRPAGFGNLQKLFVVKKQTAKNSGRSPIRALGNEPFVYQKGFSLIELLVVVLIIGILAAVALPQYQKAVLKSRFVQVQVAAKAIAQAQQRYFMANGVYATDFADLDISGVERGRYYSCGLMEEKIECYFSTTSKAFLTYMLWYQRNRITCCSYNATNYEADNICQSVTGRTTWYNGCGESEYCHCYSSSN